MSKRSAYGFPFAVFGDDGLRSNEMNTGDVSDVFALLRCVKGCQGGFMKHFVSCTPQACQAHKSMKWHVLP